MRVSRDNFDTLCSLLAAAADAAAAFYGVVFAVWLRFDSGLVPLLHTEIFPPMSMYVWGAAVVAALLVFVCRQVRLYARPQLGPFGDKLPRIVRAVSITFAAALALASVVRIPGWPPYSRTVVLLAFFSVLVFLLVVRFALFRLELHWARRSAPIRHILVVGASPVAARLRAALEREPRLRSRLAGFLLPAESSDLPSPTSIPPSDILGSIADLSRVLDTHRVDEIILADPHLSRARLLQLLNACEQRFLAFRTVPDLYGMLTTRVQVQHVADIPLLTMAPWPLDSFANRALKRLEDILGSLVGLLLSLPVILVLAPLIKRSSPGPVFYRQTRCGIGGRPFTLYKLRSMPVDAEAASGPVWATPGDARRTGVGAFLRKWNLDELPQFWNVLRGDMSLVGPRPERPFFVEQFKDDIGHYMARHVSRPGMTGWAQVNGLRGDTSIRDRLQYDLYYLENWSLSFDLKILIQTFFARDNAY